MIGMSVLISVIVPIYNSAPYLCKCLDSILTQTYQNIEVILVDDGSSDDCPAICDEYAGSDQRIIVLHKQNEGLVRARKDGIRLAHGEFVAFVDSDDWIVADMLESLEMLAEQNRADVVMSAVMVATEDSYTYKQNGVGADVYSGDKLQQLKNKLLGGEDYFSFSVLPYLWNKLWRRTLLLENLLQADESVTVGEDVVIGFPAILQAETVVVTEKAYYYYRQNNASMLLQYKNQKRECDNARRVYGYLKNRFEELGYGALAKGGLQRYFVNQIMTRSYEIVNQAMDCEGSFPFADRIEQPIIIYGAGAFGSAVYEYVSQRFEVKAWVDANADFLRTVGYPVVTLDKVDLNPNDLVIVSIFIERIAKQVQENLLRRGSRQENIKLFELSEEQETRLIEIVNLLYTGEKL